jgi:hypothetical protein
LVIDAFGRDAAGAYPARAYAAAFGLAALGSLAAALFFASGSSLPRRFRLRRISIAP